MATATLGTAEGLRDLIAELLATQGFQTREASTLIGGLPALDVIDHSGERAWRITISAERKVN